MKFKRIIKLILSSGLLVFSLTACGESETENKTDNIIIPEDSDEGLINKNVDIKMVSHFSNEVGSTEYSDTCKYNDKWFLEDSNTLNYELALLSSMACGASYESHLDNNGSKITKLLEDVGFNNIKKNTYYSEGIKLENSIGVIIGEKTIKDKNGDEYTFLAIFPRNAGYEREWAGNFNAGDNGLHEGFKLARDEMLRFTKKYIIDNNIKGKLKIWTSGYSRGAATVNLFGGFLKDNSGYFGNDVTIQNKDVFVYTIGTPLTITNNLTKNEVLSVSGPRGNDFYDTEIEAYTYNGENSSINPSSDNYKGIYNFVAKGDFIAKLPPEKWGFTRYGSTISVTYGSEKFIENINKISPSTAKLFIDKDYTTKLDIKSLDVNTLEYVNTGIKISADEFISSRIESLMKVINSRDVYVTSNYDEVLGAIASIYGLDFNEAFGNIKNDYKELIKTGIFNYLLRIKELENIEDKEALKKLIIETMNYIGKNVENEDNYTDQQLLNDLLDFFINDPINNDTAALRQAILAKLLPAPYGDLYQNLLKYAKEKEMHANNVDEVFYLLSNYITDNKTNKDVIDLVTKIVNLIPSDYMAFVRLVPNKTYDITSYPSELEMNKTILFDSFECFVKGNGNDSANTLRCGILNIVQALLTSKGLNRTSTIIVNGAKNDSETFVKEPNNISIVSEEILALLLPKDNDNKTLSIEDAANESLSNLLNKGSTSINSKYIEVLKNHPNELRNVLFTLLFDDQNKYSLKVDVDNALTFVDMIKFLLPVHNHEMYINYIKTLV